VDVLTVEPVKGEIVDEEGIKCVQDAGAIGLD